ncbi:hypothetical protein IPM62_00005 [Candidatus Woesebacteria bacterium]|nr:MAG: hypothetical protein IPM62_00005 [Candidatus Woesebacteria bacterium]
MEDTPGYAKAMDVNGVLENQPPRQVSNIKDRIRERVPWLRDKPQLTDETKKQIQEDVDKTNALDPMGSVLYRVLKVVKGEEAAQGEMEKYYEKRALAYAAEIDNNRLLRREVVRLEIRNRHLDLPVEIPNSKASDNNVIKERRELYFQAREIIRNLPVEDKTKAGWVNELTDVSYQLAQPYVIYEGFRGYSDIRDAEELARLKKENESQAKEGLDYARDVLKLDQMHASAKRVIQNNPQPLNNGMRDFQSAIDRVNDVRKDIEIRLNSDQGKIVLTNEQRQLVLTYLRESRLLLHTDAEIFAGDTQRRGELLPEHNEAFVRVLFAAVDAHPHIQKLMSRVTVHQVPPDNKTPTPPPDKPQAEAQANVILEPEQTVVENATRREMTREDFVRFLEIEEERREAIRLQNDRVHRVPANISESGRRGYLNQTTRVQFDRLNDLNNLLDNVDFDPSYGNRDTADQYRNVNGTLSRLQRDIRDTWDQIPDRQLLLEQYNDLLNDKTRLFHRLTHIDERSTFRGDRQVTVNMHQNNLDDFRRTQTEQEQGVENAQRLVNDAFKTSSHVDTGMVENVLRNQQLTLDDYNNHFNTVSLNLDRLEEPLRRQYQGYDADIARIRQELLQVDDVGERRMLLAQYTNIMREKAGLFGEIVHFSNTPDVPRDERSVLRLRVPLDEVERKQEAGTSEIPRRQSNGDFPERVIETTDSRTPPTEGAGLGIVDDGYLVKTGQARIDALRTNDPDTYHTWQTAIGQLNRQLDRAYRLIENQLSTAQLFDDRVDGVTIRFRNMQNRLGTLTTGIGVAWGNDDENPNYKSLQTQLTAMEELLTRKLALIEEFRKVSGVDLSAQGVGDRQTKKQPVDTGKPVVGNKAPESNSKLPNEMTDKAIDTQISELQRRLKDGPVSMRTYRELLGQYEARCGVRIHELIDTSPPDIIIDSIQLQDEALRANLEAQKKLLDSGLTSANLQELFGLYNGFHRILARRDKIVMGQLQQTKPVAASDSEPDKPDGVKDGVPRGEVEPREPTPTLQEQIQQLKGQIAEEITNRDKDAAMGDAWDAVDRAEDRIDELKQQLQNLESQLSQVPKSAEIKPAKAEPSPEVVWIQPAPAETAQPAKTEDKKRVEKEAAMWATIIRQLGGMAIHTKLTREEAEALGMGTQGTTAQQFHTVLRAGQAGQDSRLNYFGNGVFNSNAGVGVRRGYNTDPFGSDSHWIEISQSQDGHRTIRILFQEAQDRQVMDVHGGLTSPVVNIVLPDKEAWRLEKDLTENPGLSWEIFRAQYGSDNPEYVNALLAGIKDTGGRFRVIHPDESQIDELNRASWSKDASKAVLEKHSQVVTAKTSQPKPQNTPADAVQVVARQQTAPMGTVGTSNSEETKSTQQVIAKAGTQVTASDYVDMPSILRDPLGDQKHSGEQKSETPFVAEKSKGLEETEDDTDPSRFEVARRDVEVDDTNKVTFFPLVNKLEFVRSKGQRGSLCALRDNERKVIIAEYKERAIKEESDRAVITLDSPYRVKSFGKDVLWQAGPYYGDSTDPYIVVSSAGLDQSDYSNTDKEGRYQLTGIKVWTRWDEEARRLDVYYSAPSGNRYRMNEAKTAWEKIE